MDEELSARGTQEWPKGSQHASPHLPNPWPLTHDCQLSDKETVLYAPVSPLWMAEKEVLPLRNSWRPFAPKESTFIWAASEPDSCSPQPPHHALGTQAQQGSATLVGCWLGSMSASLGGFHPSSTPPFEGDQVPPQT